MSRWFDWTMQRLTRQCDRWGNTSWIYDGLENLCIPAFALNTHKQSSFNSPSSYRWPAHIICFQASHINHSNIRVQKQLCWAGPTQTNLRPRVLTPGIMMYFSQPLLQFVSCLLVCEQNHNNLLLHDVVLKNQCKWRLHLLHSFNRCMTSLLSKYQKINNKQAESSIILLLLMQSLMRSLLLLCLA